MKQRAVMISGNISAQSSVLLSEEALEFIELLDCFFNKSRLVLLADRRARQENFRAGELPGFLAETKYVRESDWQIESIPADLKKRHVEITGPAADAKMVINALNSGADVYMADFEDSQSPTWQNTLLGQINLSEAVRGNLTHTTNDGKQYSLNDQRAVLMMRPRGLHLEEKHVLIEDQPISASLFDFGLFAYHNAKELLKRGTGVYVYLPKIESHLEARWWNRVFNFVKYYLDLPADSIYATVLVETITAAFEMEEILYELREHVVALNCGRWDYIFSFIKKLGSNERFVLPDRSRLSMNEKFLTAYAKLLVKTCHHRGAYAMGGMSAFIPIKNNPVANDIALRKVRDDKELEVARGFDGTWVAHPGLVPLAKEIFARIGENQLSVTYPEWQPRAKELLECPKGEITPQGLRTNLRVALIYLESWLRGQGCVPIDHLMEDAATAEISRMQVWQWLTHRLVNPEAVIGVMLDEFYKINIALGEEKSKLCKYQPAFNLLTKAILAPSPPEFLTTWAYDELFREEIKDEIR